MARMDSRIFIPRLCLTKPHRQFHTKTPAIRRHSKSMAPEAGPALAAALSKKMKRQQTDKKARGNLDDSTSPLHRIAIRRLGEKDTSVDYLSGNDELTLKVRFLFYEIMSDFELRKFMVSLAFGRQP